MGRTREERRAIFRSRKELIFLFILIIIPIVIFILRTSNGYLAGAKMDWLDQHSVFPDYFRKLFYKTWNLFPEYAAGIGGGQNIYNFAYYGLFNPLYLLSYLFPFIKMSVYIQIVSLMEHIADGILCYVWLRGKKFKAEESFFASAVLILAAPVTFHSSTQLMFINYMPFLLLALIGYDRYCKNGKYGLMVCSVLLMILNSFYFAVGGMLVLFIYGVTEYNYQDRKGPVQFIKWLWHQFYPALLGCFLSLFYLAPVYFAMTAGRNDKAGISLKGLFTPDISVKKLLYSPYGMGLTLAALIILCISLFYKKCREKMMAVILGILLIFPVFDWMLNGGLYLRNKAFIPFLPLICWLIAAFFQRVRERKIQVFQVLGGYLLAAVLVIMSGKVKNYGSEKIIFIYVDLIVCAVILILRLSLWKYAVGLGMIVVMGVMSVIQINSLKDKMVTEKFMQSVENTDIQKAVNSILKDDTEFYRTEVRKGYDENRANQNRVCEQNQNLTTVYSSVENTDYQRFCDDILNLSRPSRNKLMQVASDNPVFLRFMGVKYIVGDSAPAGYEKIGVVGNENIFENKNAAPTAYVTDKIMTEEDFLNLSYPERQMTLLKSAVADLKNESDSKQVNVDVVNCKAQIPEQKEDKLVIRDIDNGVRVKASEKSFGTMSLNTESRTDGYLFLTFDVKNNNSSKDVVITVNGERNKLSSKRAAYFNGNTTFHYASSISGSLKEVPVIFGKGDYEITNIKAWLGFDNPDDAQELYQNPVSLNLQASGNVLTGTALAGKNGWLITSIPYDDGFTLLVDGKQQKIQKVNTGFVGLPLEEGQHEIKLIYHSRGMKEGILITLITAAVIAADYFRRNRKYEKNLVDNIC